MNTCTSTATAVAVSNDIYTPKCTTVPVGASVTWTWTANATNTHSVTFATGTSAPVQGPGATFTRSFPATGTFNYNCTVHPGMTGSIKVQ